MTAHETLLTRLEKGVLYITLNRPHLRNAMNQAMVEELLSIFEGIAENRKVRAVVLCGAEGNFCSGGDIKDMAGLLVDSPDGQALAAKANRRFGDLICAVDRAPQATICVIEGVALGGGFGLVCVSDIAFAHTGARFGLPETGLGIPPAQIAPFVVRRIGLTQARRLAVLGSRFDGKKALGLGLVHDLFASESEAQELVNATLAEIRRCGPQANAITKQLMLDVGRCPIEELLDRAATDFAACIRGPEGREGTSAFREKRIPAWAREEQ